MQKTYQFTTQCKGDISHAFNTAKITVFEPMMWKSPDVPLQDELLRLDVLSRRQCADVRSERTVYERNDALLDLLTSEEQCDKFLKALERTHQQHVANFILQNGGKKHIDVVTNYQLNVARGDKQKLYCTRRLDSLLLRISMQENLSVYNTV